MTPPVRAVRVGGPTSFTPVRVGPTAAPGGDAGVVLGVNRPTLLEELGNVDPVATAPDGAVLTKRGGTWRGLLPDHPDWLVGDGPPPPVIPGASPGDMYLDRIGKGLYRLT